MVTACTRGKNQTDVLTLDLDTPKMSVENREWGVVTDCALGGVVPLASPGASATKIFIGR